MADFRSRERIEWGERSTGTIYVMLTDEELRGPFQSAGIRIVLLHGRQDLYPTEGGEFEQLNSLSKIQRAELERS